MRFTVARGCAIYVSAWLRFRGPMLFTLREKESRSRASARSRQQRRPGAARAEEEKATRRGVPRDEAPPQLRKAVRTARSGKGRSRAALPQAPAQANGARRLLKPPPASTKSRPAPPRRLL